jgi:hypothetical protein
MSKYGRGLNREVVAAINNGSINEPFSVREVRRLIRERGWNPPPTEKYIAVTMANGASDDHSFTYVKYFHSDGNGFYSLRPEYQGTAWE